MHSDNEMVRLRDVVETLIYMTDEDSDGVEEVMQLPTIDIVRCRECKHRYRSGYRGDEYWVCDFMDAKIKADGFCYMGERKSDE